jgi:hypothetical protein
VAIAIAKRPDDLKVAISMFKAVVSGQSIKAAGIDLGLSYTQAAERFWQASQIVQRYVRSNSIQVPYREKIAIDSYRLDEAFWIEISDSAQTVLCLAATT